MLGAEQSSQSTIEMLVNFRKQTLSMCVVTLFAPLLRTPVNFQYENYIMCSFAHFCTYKKPINLINESNAISKDHRINIKSEISSLLKTIFCAVSSNGNNIIRHSQREKRGLNLVTKLLSSYYQLIKKKTFTKLCRLSTKWSDIELGTLEIN